MSGQRKGGALSHEPRSASPPLSSRNHWSKGVAHLRGADPRIRELIDARGSIRFRPTGRTYETLVESILSQQLNGKAASVITARVQDVLSSESFNPEALAKVSISRLRAAGVSTRKAQYMKDLAKKVVNGRIDLEALASLGDQEVQDRLDALRGIGPWTAQMVLIFSMGRPDVLPVDDFGIKSAVKEVYGLRAIPDADKITALAEPWRPYRTIASLYLWHHRDGSQ